MDLQQLTVEGGGEAWGIGDRTALAVGGTSTHLPESPVLYSHLFSHEMGHILGLLHTHQDASGGSHLSTGDELVDQVNNPDQCLFSGDCICDTPAEFN